MRVNLKFIIITEDQIIPSPIPPDLSDTTHASLSFFYHHTVHYKRNEGVEYM